MWKKIGIKQEKDVSVTSSQKGYKRVRQIDQNSICQKEFSGSGSPINGLRKNNSEIKFEAFVQSNKIYNSSRKNLDQKLNNNEHEQSPYFNVERNRISIIENMKNDKSERFSGGKSMNKEVPSVQLINQNCPSIDKNQSSNIVNEAIQKKQETNKCIQSQKKFFLHLMHQIVPNLQNTGKFDISSIASDKKLMREKQKNQYVNHLEEKVKKLRKIKEIYQSELANLRQIQFQLLEFTRSQLKKYGHLFQTLRNEMILLILLKPKSEEIEMNGKAREKQIQQKIRRIQIRESELSTQEKILGRKKIDLDKQQDTINIRLTELLHKQQLISQYEVNMLKQQDLRQKQQNIEQQQKNLLNRFKQLEIKEEILLSKERAIQKKTNRIKSKEQETILTRDKNKESSHHRQNKLPKPKNSINLQMVNDLEQKQSFESVNTLLTTINAMKNNLDEISGYNQKFSKTLEKSRSHNLLINNLVKMENERVI